MRHPELNERPAVANGALAALPDKWRKLAGLMDNDFAASVTRSFAAELEAVLQQPTEAAHYRGYLPVDCPSCGRRRLEYDLLVDGTGLKVVCEKCGYDGSWDLPTPAPAPEPVCSFAHNQLMGIFDCDFDEGRDDCNVHPGERVQAAMEDAS